MKLLILALTLVSAGNVLGAENELSYQVPSYWIHGDQAIDESQIDPKFGSATEEIFRTILAPLEKYDKMDDLAPMTVNQKPRWGVRGVAFDMTVSTTGSMGVLLMKGAASAMVTWKHKPTASSNRLDLESSAAQMYSSNESDVTDIVVDFTDPAKQIEPAVKSLMATGKIKNESALRKNLTKVMGKFQDMVRGAQVKSSHAWSIGVIRLDLQASGTGVVGPFTAAGAGLRVRLEWTPVPKSSGKNSVVALDDDGKNMRGKLSQFLENIVTEMDRWSLEDPVHKRGLDLQLLRIGLGLTAKYKLGVATNTAAAIFHVGFARKRIVPTYDVLAVRPEPFIGDQDHALYQLSASTPEDTNAGWNKIFGLSTEEPKNTSILSGSSLADHNALPVDKLLKVSSEQFRKGLNRAASMSLFLMDHGKSVLKDSKWEVAQVRTGITFEPTGALTIVTLTGTASAELFFNKVNLN